MAKAKVTKRFELSVEAAAELESRAKLVGMSQTAFVEAWLNPAGPFEEQIKKSGPLPVTRLDPFPVEMVRKESVSGQSLAKPCPVHSPKFCEPTCKHRR